MSETKVDFMSQANTWVFEPAKRAYSKLETQWQSFGRQFSVWSDNSLAHPWNNVAKKIFYSLPIATAIFMLPLSFSVAGGFAFYVADLGYGPFSKETHETAIAGACVGSSAVTMYSLGALITTLRPGFAIDALVYGAASTLLFPHAKLNDA
jgi:hypothetical protein